MNGGAAVRDREAIIGIGERIRQARKAAGLTQEQAADRVGVSRSAWSLWECARYCLGALEVIRIAEALGVTVGWLLLGEDDKRPGLAERERIKGLFDEWITLIMSEPNSHPPEAWIAGFADLIGDKPTGGSGE